jgi:hypothetical protein
MRDVLFQPCGDWSGQCAMFSLLRDGVRLGDEEQSLREPFLHRVDQVGKVLGNLIHGVLHRLVRALILVTHRLDNVAGCGFDPSQRLEHVEYASTALRAPWLSRSPARCAASATVLPEAPEP